LAGESQAKPRRVLLPTKTARKADFNLDPLRYFANLLPTLPQIATQSLFAA